MGFKPRVRDAVYAKCKGRCGYCGVVIQPDAFTADHIKPQVFGGTDDLDNLMPACRQCNNYKHFFSLEEFRGMIHRQIDLLRIHSTNFRTAQRFGMIETKVPERIVFYFEQQPSGGGEP